MGAFRLASRPVLLDFLDTKCIFIYIKNLAHRPMCEAAEDKPSPYQAEDALHQGNILLLSC